MNREEEIKQILRERFREFEQELEEYTVFLFGSRAGGSAKPRSDFDIGVLGPCPLPVKTFYKIEDMLDSIETLYTFDWVDLNRVSESFRNEALQDTEVLYEGAEVDS